MPTALGYGRKSVVRNAGDIVGVDKQRLHVARLADQRGESIEWFEDAEGHRSGTSDRARPGFQRLLARLQNDPAVSSVIVYELDRAARSVLLIDRIIKLCQARSVAFICIKDGIDTSRGLGANEVMRIQLLAVLAEGEANRVGERMRDTARYYRDELRIPWGMWPFGFRRDGHGKQAHFAPNPPHDDTVRRLFSVYLAGNGYRETAGALNRLGYAHIDRYGRPKPFNAETVRTVVGNVLFYAGYSVGVKHKAKQAEIALQGDGTYLERYARAMRAQRAPAITPLIDEETASAVIERRSRNQWTGRKPGGWVALLTPIAYCDGRKLTAQTRDYGCFYRTRGPGSICIDGAAVDAGLISRLRNLRIPQQMRADIRRVVKERIGEAARAALQAQESRALAEMELLIDLLSSGQVDRAVYNARYTRLEAKLSEARRQMNAPTEADRLMDALTDLAAAIDLMPAVKRKQAVAHLVERVDLAPDGEIVRLHLREWAQAAFADLASAVSTVPPVSDGHEEDTALGWLISVAA